MDHSRYAAIQEHVSQIQARRRDEARQARTIRWLKGLLVGGGFSLTVLVSPAVGWSLTGFWVFGKLVNFAVNPPSLSFDTDPETDDVATLTNNIVVRYAAAGHSLALSAPNIKASNASNRPRLMAALSPADRHRLESLDFRIKSQTVWVSADISREQLAALTALVVVLGNVRHGLREHARKAPISDAVNALVHLAAEQAMPSDIDVDLRAIARAANAGEHLVVALQRIDSIRGALAMLGLRQSDAVSKRWLKQVADVMIRAEPDSEAGLMHRWAWLKAAGRPAQSALDAWLASATADTARFWQQLEPLLSPTDRQSIARALQIDGQLSLAAPKAGLLTEAGD